MDGRVALDYQRAALWLADLHEELDVMRYPTRVEMIRAVEEAMRRAESLARLERVLCSWPGSDPRVG
jgi:hypothetical protein